MDTSQIQKDFLPVIKSCFTDKLLDFQGRTGQTEFAIFIIFAFVAMIVVSMVVMPWLTMLVSLAFLIPCLSITVRRLNDIGMQPIFAILLFIPIINLLFLVYLGVQPSKT